MTAADTRADRIRAALTAAFAPDVLEIEDKSARHEGHAGARPEGETHYRVTIVADAFSGLGRVDAHRKVNAVLQPEFDAGLHALAISAKGTG